MWWDLSIEAASWFIFYSSRQNLFVTKQRDVGLKTDSTEYEPSEINFSLAELITFLYRLLSPLGRTISPLILALEPRQDGFRIISQAIC